MDEPFRVDPTHPGWGLGLAPDLTRSPGGCSLFEAAWRFAEDRETGRLFADLYIRSKITSGNPDPLMLDDLQQLSDLRDQMEAELLFKLRTGELVATWLPPGRDDRCQIHPEWWTRAWIDLWISQAQVDETIRDRIEVCRPLPAQASPSPEKPQPKATYSPQALGSWFMLRVHTWPKELPAPTEADCQSAAEDFFDSMPTRGGFREIRKGKVPQSWQKRGPRKPR